MTANDWQVQGYQQAQWWPNLETVHKQNQQLKGNNWWINSYLPKQNGSHFPDNIFKCIFMNENFCILIKISLKIVPKCPIDNKSALG